MKIYTKKGDQGKTSLVDGSPISKSDIRLDTYGTVDELNSQMGLLMVWLSQDEPLKSLHQELQSLQNQLFQLGSQLACTDASMAEKLPTITEQDIKSLEKGIDTWDQELPALKSFILPGGHQASAQAHICRTVSRRAERLCTLLNEQSPLSFPAVAYLNRLSDYFFVLARVINHRMEIPCPEWKS